MKSDGTTIILNFILAALVILGVWYTYFSITRQREFRQLTTNATIANGRLTQAQRLLNDTAYFNATAKSPELTRVLQSVQTAQAKPAAR
jgi:hypothetical protein